MENKILGGHTLMPEKALILSLSRSLSLSVVSSETSLAARLSILTSDAEGLFSYLHRIHARQIDFLVSWKNSRSHFLRTWEGCKRMALGCKSRLTVRMDHRPSSKKLAWSRYHRNIDPFFEFGRAQLEDWG